MTTTGPAPGLRRQLTFEEAAELAEVKGPEIHFDYAALRLTQSPLFQRLGEKMEDDIGAQNAARMSEVERQHNVTRIAAQSGVTRADLEEVLKQAARTPDPPPPPPPQQDGVPPPPPPPTGGFDPPDPGPRTDGEGGTLPVGPDPKQEAERLHLMAEIQRLSTEQEKMKKQATIAQEMTARLSTSNARDPRAQLIRELHHHHVHPIGVPVPVPNQNQDNGPLIELLRNALTSQNNNIGRVAEQLGMSITQITEMLRGTARPNEVNITPPPKPTVFNIGTPTRGRSRSPPPGDEEMRQTAEPTPPAKSTYGPVGRTPPRVDPYEPTPQVVRPKPLPSGTPAPETPQVARPKARPSRAPVPDTPQMVRASSARPSRASEPETPVLARGLSQDTVRYQSRSRSRAAETPQFQPPRRTVLPLAIEPETPQMAASSRGRSPGERALAPVPETPQLPEKLRKRFEKQRQRAQRHGQLREGMNKFLEQQRVKVAAQQAEASAAEARAFGARMLKKRSIAEQIEAVERSGERAANELSPQIRKQPPPIGTFMSRQKTIGGEVRRYKRGPT